MRKIIHVAGFVGSCVMLAGCGATNPVAIDHSVIWVGGTNQVLTGGYWFTYTDHITWMAQHNDRTLNPAGHTADQGATIAPLTDMSTPLPIVPDPDVTSGHGDTIHVQGSTPGAPDWNDVRINGNWFDTFFQQPQLYPDALTVAYPLAGVGFSFVPNTASGFDPSQGGTSVGFVFDMKTFNTVDMDVHLGLVCSAYDGNDLHNDTVADAFPKPGCNYAKLQGTGESLTQQAADYYSGPDNYQTQSCFAYQQKNIVPIKDGRWDTYCVLWNEMTLPDWASPTAQTPQWSDATLAQCATKLKWEMNKPATGSPPAAFDVYLDNIKLVTRAEAGAYGCDMSKLPVDHSQVIGPTANGNTAS